MKCYVCQHEQFVVNLITITTVERIDDTPTIAYSNAESPLRINTIFCAKCNVLQYCGDKSEDPWFIGNVTNLEYDEAHKKLMPKKKSKGSPIKIESFIANASQEQLIAALAMLRKEQEDKI